MAFPSSLGSKPNDLASAWTRIRAYATQVKQTSQQITTASAAGSIGADQVVTYAAGLADAKDRFAIDTAVAGIAAYAQQQVNDATLDIVAAYNTMLTQINATLTWIANNFPKDGSGNLLYVKFDANGRLVITTFTTAQLAGFRTQVNALIATID